MTLMSYVSSLQPGSRFTLADLRKADVVYGYGDVMAMVRKGLLIKETHGHKGSCVVFSRTDKRHDQ